LKKPIWKGDGVTARPWGPHGITPRDPTASVPRDPTASPHGTPRHRPTGPTASPHGTPQHHSRCCPPPPRAGSPTSWVPPVPPKSQPHGGVSPVSPAPAASPAPPTHLPQEEDEEGEEQEPGEDPHHHPPHRHGPLAPGAGAHHLGDGLRRDGWVTPPRHDLSPRPRRPRPPYRGLAGGQDAGPEAVGHGRGVEPGSGLDEELLEEVFLLGTDVGTRGDRHGDTWGRRETRGDAASGVLAANTAPVTPHPASPRLLSTGPQVPLGGGGHGGDPPGTRWPPGAGTCCRVSIQSRARTLTSARWSLARLGTRQAMATHAALPQSCATRRASPRPPTLGGKPPLPTPTRTRRGLRDPPRSPRGWGPPARLPGGPPPPGAPGGGCRFGGLRPWAGGSPAGRRWRCGGGHRLGTHPSPGGPRAAPYLLGVEGGRGGAGRAPLGAQLQQVEQDAAAQPVGDGEAQGDPADGARTLVVELREGAAVTPGRGRRGRTPTPSTHGCSSLPGRRAPP